MYNLKAKIIFFCNNDFFLKTSSFFFLLSMIAITRQFPFSFFNPLIIPFLILSIFCYIIPLRAVDKNKIKVFLIIILFLIFCAIYSIIKGDDIHLVIRFFSILVLINIPIAFNVGNYRYIKVFKIVMFIQCLFIILIAIYMGVVYNHANYSVVRSFVQSHDWGDIYTYNGFYYRVQVIGNALLPCYFFLQYIEWKEKKVLLYFPIIAFVAVIFAGNLAYLISVILFIIGYELINKKGTYKKVSKYEFLALMGFFILFPFLIIYIHNLIIMKSQGNGSSIGLRFEQFYVLFDGLTATWVTTLFGQGLGYLVGVTDTIRDYSHSVYYELQSVYILTQLGLVPFFLLLCAHLYLFLNKINKNCILMYMSYLIFATTNPYIFDSNQIITLIVIMSLNLAYKNRDVVHG